MKPAQEMKGRADLETTGPNPALSDQVTAAVTARHPTLNTKPLFKLMVEKKASDLFFTSNAPIKIKIEGQILPVNKQVLSPETVRQTAFALMSPEQREHFVNEWELDFAVSEPGLGRFRVNVFMQRGYPAMVLRYITADMPRMDNLGLPDTLTDLIMLNSPLIQDLIFKGEVAKIKEVMSRSTRLGMKTFDQALFELYETGFISYEDALRNADSKNELRLRIKLEGKREAKTVEDAAALQVVEEEPGRSL